MRINIYEGDMLTGRQEWCYRGSVLVWFGSAVVRGGSKAVRSEPNQQLGYSREAGSVRDRFQFNAFSRTFRNCVAVLFSHVTFIRDLIGCFLLWVFPSRLHRSAAVPCAHLTLASSEFF